VQTADDRRAAPSACARHCQEICRGKSLLQPLDDSTVAGRRHESRLLYARNHGFQGHWLNGLSQSEPFTNTGEPIEAFDAASLFPSWLPQQETANYLGFVQQYVHNLNLLRFLLDADQQTKTRVETVSLDADGMTGLTVLHLSGVRSLLETATSKFHSWTNKLRSILKAAGSDWRPRVFSPNLNIPPWRFMKPRPFPVIPTLSSAPSMTGIIARKLLTFSLRCKRVSHSFPAEKTP
jgi:hypothetical protein